MSICIAVLFLEQVKFLSWISSLPEPDKYPHLERKKYKIPDFIGNWEIYQNYTSNKAKKDHAFTKLAFETLISRVSSSRVLEDEDPNQTTVFTDAYRLEIDQRKILGSGASGFVYPGTLKWAENTYEHDVAVKVSYHPQLLWQAQIMDLIQGTHLMSYLGSLVIAQPDDTNARDGLVYALIMPRMQGSLQSWTAALSREERQRRAHHTIMLQIWEGLVELHSQGFAHRDVKLANMVYTWNEAGEMRVVISDLDQATPIREIQDSGGTLGLLSRGMISFRSINTNCYLTKALQRSCLAKNSIR